jgi:hypothetical protein
MAPRDLDVPSDNHAPVRLRPFRIQGIVVCIRWPSAKSTKVLVQGYLIFDKTTNDTKKVKLP